MMKPIYLLSAASLMFATSVNATTGTINSDDGSKSQAFSYSTSSSGNQFEEASGELNASFTLHGAVTKTCSLGATDADNRDGGEVGAHGNIDLGTIGIRAGDELGVSDLFTMTGPAHVKIHSPSAGCNYTNTVELEKDNILGLVNADAVSYDSDQFVKNLKYNAKVTFKGVKDGDGAATGSLQSVSVSDSQSSNDGKFGAWRSPMDIDVDVPVVNGKGLVGGTYTGTLTMELEIS